MQILFFILLILILIPILSFQRYTIYEYQLGLLYKRGKYVGILKPGQYVYSRLVPHKVIHFDTRTVSMTIPGQELISADNVGIKISLAVGYRIVDPYLAVSKVINYQEILYLTIQLNLREIVGSLTIDDILAKRGTIGKQLFEKSKEQAAEIGLELCFVNVKDLMLPGELKSIFAQVINAQKEGLAILERARGESAALRNLANAARMLENNPNLFRLRLLQTIEKNSGNIVILLPGENGVASKLLSESREGDSE